jgi:GrpB-like predicted nucleotidyltransferase (UPF0157 family)/hypothetical membrane protein
VLSLALTTIQGAFREGFDPWQQAVSALSLGPRGWLQSINLIAFGIFVLSTVSPWRKILAGARGGTAYPAFTALVGAGFIGVGIFPQDPAPGYDPQGLALHSPTPYGIAHLAIAGVAALSSVIGLFVIAARLARDPAWPRWALYSCATALVVIGCVAVYGVWSTKPSGFAGTFERGAIVAPMLWMFAFLRRLRRGAPLMVAATTEGVTLGVERGTVRLAAAHADWARDYDVEVERLSARLAHAQLPPLVFEHIGSTAVPGLIAKPIIDFMAGYGADTDPRAYFEVLREAGYEHRGPQGVPRRELFVLGPPSLRTHHLNLVRAHDSFWRDHIVFRDRLRSEPDVAAEYAQLKQRLASRHSTDRAQYTAAKAAFVQEVLINASRPNDVPPPASPR